MIELFLYYSNGKGPAVQEVTRFLKDLKVFKIDTYPFDGKYYKYFISFDASKDGFRGTYFHGIVTNVKTIHGLLRILKYERYNRKLRHCTEDYLKVDPILTVQIKKELLKEGY